MADLAIIIVSWNVAELLRRCLRSVEASLAAGGLAARVLVVDNASRDGTPAMVRAEFPAVELIEAGANLGFAGGNNLALRRLGLGGGAAPAGCPRAVLLLNPDTEVVGDAIPRLLAHLDAHPGLAAVGPRLRYGDGSVQSSRRRLPEAATYFFESTPLERAWPANPWSRRYHCAEAPDDREQAVGWLVGAALMARSGAVARAGLLDERFFMYSEELEWQARMGGPVAYLPAAEVTHYEGKSSEQAMPHRHLNFQRSKLLLARMRHGWAFAGLLRRFLLCCYAYEAAVEAAKLALGHRPELRRQRLAVYRAVLADGLREHR